MVTAAAAVVAGILLDGGGLGAVATAAGVALLAVAGWAGLILAIKAAARLVKLMGGASSAGGDAYGTPHNKGPPRARSRLMNLLRRGVGSGPAGLLVVAALGAIARLATAWWQLRSPLPPPARAPQGDPAYDTGRGKVKGAGRWRGRAGGGAGRLRWVAGQHGAD